MSAYGPRRSALFYIKRMSICRGLVRRLNKRVGIAAMAAAAPPRRRSQMRFMYTVTSSRPGPPTPELLEAMHKLAQREIKAGRMLDNGGLMAPAMGAQGRSQRGQLSVVDGPFVETKEVIGGYAIFELRDKEEALASAKEFMQLHKDLMPGWEGTRDLRMFAGVLGEKLTPVGGHDGRRRPSRDLGRLADRTAVVDH